MRTTEAHAQFCEDFIEAMNSRDTEGSSAEATPEPASPAKVVGSVATGWVLASGAKFLYGYWRSKARDAEEKAETWRGIVDVLGDGGDYYRGVAEGYRQAIQDLRAELALQKRRQPAPNS